MKSLKTAFGFGLMYLTSKLPLSWMQGVGGWIGRRMYASNATLCRITRVNIERCYPELSSEQQEQLIRASLEQTGCSFLEMGLSFYAQPQRVHKMISEVENEQLLIDALEQGRGVILAAPHFGNWEVLNLYVSSKYPITVMYKPPKSEALDKFIQRSRARLGADMAPANSKGVKQVLRTLKKGGLCGILPDQEPPEGSGAYADFFGYPAYTMTLVSQLARQTGCRVVLGFAQRLDGAEGYKLRFETVADEVNSRDLDTSLAALNQGVELVANTDPRQYQWEYKRFNRQQDGSIGPYRKAIHGE